MLLRLLDCPLFPYTTLFLSLLAVEHVLHLIAVRRFAPVVHGRAALLGGGVGVALLHLHRHRATLHDRVRPERRDRKSTRLNSSHSQISYAVICLKKKTKQ